MNAVPLIVGLDIGTTKVCTLIGVLTEDQRVEVRGVGMAPSAGLRRGAVIDPEGITEAIRRSADAAQRASGLNLSGAHVYVGVTGDHVASLNCEGRVSIQRPNDEIQIADVDRVKAAAVNRLQSATHDILLERPREFRIDGRGGISDPLHLTGRELEVVLHVVTAERRFMEQVQHCVERAGLPVDQLVLESVATGEAVCRKEEHQLGVCVLDLGGGTCDLAVYLDGQLAHTAAIPVGGAHVTYDLSYGLEAPYPLAEKLKREHAGAITTVCDPTALVSYRNVRGDDVQVEQVFLAEIVGPRMEELFELVLEDLARAGLQPRQFGAGVVLSGGASRLAGTLALARQMLGVMVRDGQPIEVLGQSQQVAGPEYSTAVGLLKWGGADQAARLLKLEQRSVIARMRSFWRRFTGLFE
ncbi:MAG: cell division protein FtsA [Fimbriimonadaceae bacterium]|nr:cell division protein FtsA [Fimbriimonadaceae bacterium]